MNHHRLALLGTFALAFLSAVALFGAWAAPRTVLAQGVGRATWTPADSETEAIPSELLVPGDSITYSTAAVWSEGQTRGLRRYVDGGLRYTHEINDRSGRLSATGYWATNYPDPAFDRDDDDGDRRWEEAEITAGTEPPKAGTTYSTLLQFSRWRGKRRQGACVWAWDRRQGAAEVLSQLSRDLLGEWQAERFTLTYDSLAYPRVGTRPTLPAKAATARCGERRPRPGQSGIVVTFAAPLSWSALMDLQDSGSGRWTAWEAIGTKQGDPLTWTCGGPIDDDLRLAPCRAMGVRPEGITAAIGYYSEAAANVLRDDRSVAQIDGLRDAVTSLLSDLGGFGVEPPDLTINDAYWDLFLSD